MLPDQILNDLKKNPGLLSLLFIDGVDTKHAYKDIESREPGYFQAMGAAFIDCLYQMKQGLISLTIDLDFIKSLHHQCIERVKNLNHGVENKQFSQGTHFGLSIEFIHSNWLKNVCINNLKKDPDRGIFYLATDTIPSRLVNGTSANCLFHNWCYSLEQSSVAIAKTTIHPSIFTPSNSNSRVLTEHDINLFYYNQTIFYVDRISTIYHVLNAIPAPLDNYFKTIHDNECLVISINEFSDQVIRWINQDSSGLTSDEKEELLKLKHYGLGLLKITFDPYTLFKDIAVLSQLRCQSTIVLSGNHYFYVDSKKQICIRLNALTPYLVDCFKTMDEQEYRVVSLSRFSEFISILDKSFYQQINTIFMNRIIADYNSDILRAQSDRERLECIINAAQRFERLHPFADANCRTFCMMFVNVQLVRWGMVPCFQDDPNDFDYLPLVKVVALIEKGQQRYQNFTEKQFISPLFKSLQTKATNTIHPDWFRDPIHQRDRLFIKKKLKQYEEQELFLTEMFSNQPVLYSYKRVQLSWGSFYTFEKQRICQLSELVQIAWFETLESFKWISQLLQSLPVSFRLMLINTKNRGVTKLYESSLLEDPGMFERLLTFIPPVDRLSCLREPNEPVNLNGMQTTNFGARHTILQRAVYLNNSHIIKFSLNSLPKAAMRKRIILQEDFDIPGYNLLHNVMSQSDFSAELLILILSTLPENKRLNVLTAQMMPQGKSAAELLSSQERSQVELPLVLNLLPSAARFKCLKHIYGSLEKALYSLACQSAHQAIQLIISDCEPPKRALLLTKQYNSKSIIGILTKKLACKKRMGQKTIKILLDLFELLAPHERTVVYKAIPTIVISDIQYGLFNSSATTELNALLSSKLNLNSRSQPERDLFVGNITQQSA